MAELSTLARPYAKAAFERALETSDLSSWYEALQLAAQVSQAETMKLLLLSPSLTNEEKSTAFVDVCGDALDKQQQNFLKVLADNKRLGLLPEIFALYGLYKANQEKTVDVDISTAFEISSAMQKTLAETLKKKLNRDVTLQTSVDDSLLGGALIRAGDTVIDGSVRGRLAKLAEAMNA